MDCPLVLLSLLEYPVLVWGHRLVGKDACANQGSAPTWKAWTRIFSFFCTMARFCWYSGSLVSRAACTKQVPDVGKTDMHQ